MHSHDVAGDLTLGIRRTNAFIQWLYAVMKKIARQRRYHECTSGSSAEISGPGANKSELDVGTSIPDVKTSGSKGVLDIENF